MSNKFIDAMDLVSELNKSHGVTQRGGKQYTEVAKRVEAFRATFGGEYGIETELLHNDGKTVIVRAFVSDAQGFIIGSGIAEEIRGSNNITKTSAVEVCETSAIGRALASLGLHGGQYASANEIEGVSRKEQAIKSVTPNGPSMNLDLEARVEASLQFYENCNAEAFEKAEKKYQKLIETIGLSEDQYEALVQAHNDRKTELKI
jgi:hypothetical protein